MCLGEDSFEWSLRGDLLATWTWMSKSDPIWDFPGTIPVSKISVSFSLSSTSGIPVMCKLFLWMLSHSSHRFFHICFILFSFFVFWLGNFNCLLHYSFFCCYWCWEGNRQEGQGSPNRGNRLQVSDIFISLKWQQETNGRYFFFFLLYTNVKGGFS